MQENNSFWQVWKKKSANLSLWMLPVAVCFLELLFHIWVGGTISVAAMLNLMGFSLAFGGLLNILISVLPSKGGK